jgi:hypothetical protein
MLATGLEDPRKLADPCYSAETKLARQRARVHVVGTSAFQSDAPCAQRA